jgi:hypothetical protein
MYNVQQQIAVHAAKQHMQHVVMEDRRDCLYYRQKQQQQACQSWSCPCCPCTVFIPASSCTCHHHPCTHGVNLRAPGIRRKPSHAVCCTCSSNRNMARRCSTRESHINTRPCLDACAPKSTGQPLALPAAGEVVHTLLRHQRLASPSTSMTAMHARNARSSASERPPRSSTSCPSRLVGRDAPLGLPA